jgi:hypothetical protein
MTDIFFCQKFFDPPSISIKDGPNNTKVILVQWGRPRAQTKLGLHNFMPRGSSSRASEDWVLCQ